MLTSVVSSVTSSVSSASSAASSAASSTSVLVTGIVTASAIVAVLLFATLLSREMAISMEEFKPGDVTALKAVLVPLALAFTLNLVVETVPVLT